MVVQMVWERFGRADSICLRDVNALPTVVFPIGTDQPIGAGCPGTLLAVWPPVCLSSDPTTDADTSQDR